MKPRKPIKVKTHRNCDNCGTEFKRINSFQRYCGSACMREKEGYPEKKPKNTTPKEKGLSDYKSDLQTWINTIVKLIDKGHPCIAQPNIKSIRIEAGHCVGRGANETLRYNLLNIWAESHENNQRTQDSSAFKAGLENIYGKVFLIELEALKSHPPIKLTVDEIKQKISICKSISAWLKIQDRKFSNTERMYLRRKFNSEIGIYS